MAGKSEVTTDNKEVLNETLDNTFDADKVGEELGAQVDITQTFDQERRKVKTELNDKEKELRDAAEEAKARGDSKQAETLKKQADDIQDQALAFDSITGALYGPNSNGVTGYVAKAVSPYVSNQIGQYFKKQDQVNKDNGNTELAGTQSPQHLLAHAILGGAVSYATGNDALTGGLSAATGEATAPLLMEYLYETDNPDELTAEQKDTISVITGLVGTTIGATTGNVTDAVNAGETSKVAVEGNALSNQEIRSFYNKAQSARSCSASGTMTQDCINKLNANQKILEDALSLSFQNAQKLKRELANCKTYSCVKDAYQKIGNLSKSEIAAMLNRLETIGVGVQGAVLKDGRPIQSLPLGEDYYEMPQALRLLQYEAEVAVYHRLYEIYKANNSCSYGSNTCMNNFSRDVLQKYGFESKDSVLIQYSKEIKAVGLDNIDRAIESGDIGPKAGTFMYTSLQFLPQEEWELILPAVGGTVQLGGKAYVVIKTRSGAKALKGADEAVAEAKVGNNFNRDNPNYDSARHQAINNRQSDAILNQQASKKVSQVKAPIDFDGHIINGEIKNGKVVGGHSTHGNVKVDTVIKRHSNGVYEAKVSVKDSNNPNNYLPKTNNNGQSTMFPDSWTGDRIKVEVDYAYQNRKVNGNRWTGTTQSGVKVEGWLKPKTTVYPSKNQ